MTRRDNHPESQVSVKGDVHQGAGSVVGTDSSQNKVVVDQSQRHEYSREAKRKSSTAYWLLASGLVALAVFVAAWFLIPTIPYHGWICLGIGFLAGIIMLRMNPDYWARSMISFLILLVFGGGLINLSGAFEASSEHLGHVSGKFDPVDPPGWYYISAAVVIVMLIVYEARRLR